MGLYATFSDLAAAEVHGVDYEIVARHRPRSHIAVIAPHGGWIEWGTTQIAEQIAGDVFSFYSFHGLKRRESRRLLHITSHLFDEPACLSLVAAHDYVVAIHGCQEDDEKVFLGGLDKPLIHDLDLALRAAKIAVACTDHSYPGVHPNNICNRSARGAGVQIELSWAFRQGGRVPLFVETVRNVFARFEDLR